MDFKDFWLNLLKRLYPTISHQNFVSWFKNTAALSLKDGVLTIGVPTPFAQKWVSEKYETKVLQAAREINPEVKELAYEVHSSLEDPTDTRRVNLDLFIKKESKPRKVARGKEISYGNGLRSRTLNPRYSLNNFVVGKDNRLPHAACMAVSNMPGGIYNPLFVYGGVGLGKTHLLQATGNEMLKLNPNMKVVYMSAEKFVTEIVEAIGKRYTKEFKAKYRHVDCLLLDDVQFFERKDSSQQEFFHTFDELYNANKQILISSDRPPSELEGLDDRLVSRFSMGMVVELIFPDFETRMAILQTKCQEHRIIIDNEILEFIAYNTQTSIRELEGILLQVVAQSQIEKTTPTLRSVADVMKKLNRTKEIVGLDERIAEARSVIRTAEDVITLVAAYFNVTKSELLGNDRRREYMMPRQVCMYLLRHELSQSYQKIGEDFGGRNHTTVLHACNKVSEAAKADPKLVRDINAIKREMGL
ncbi:MAG: chromosomal replication initiator protein DnaA [Patescibacteria group bacterium]|nr:chromosomal replication initiator protein DnaA [Patescibacteria group bacterium]